MPRLMRTPGTSILLLITSLFSIAHHALGKEDEGNATIPLFSEEWWFYLGISAVIILIGGLMAGLTLGLMSLDTVSLHVLMDSGTESEKRHARRILPIRKDGHLLLCTLLLTNTATNEALPVVLESILAGWISVVVSTGVVLIMGEIIPQAVCARYGLQIGGYSVYFVRFLIIVAYPIAKPIALLLDFLLGRGHGVIYKRAGLKALINVHTAQSGHGGNLTQDEASIISGTLELESKTAEDVMMPMDVVFMLNIEGVFDRETMTMLLSRGHSRVPVFEGNHNQVVAIILVKSLILLDPDDAVPIRSVVEGHRGNVLYVPSSTSLFALLDGFQEGASHLALVVAPDWQPGQALLGIVTLEDVLEEIIQENIVDETDEYTDVASKTPLPKKEEVMSRWKQVAWKASKGIPVSDHPVQRGLGRGEPQKPKLVSMPSSSSFDFKMLPKKATPRSFQQVIQSKQRRSAAQSAVHASRRHHHEDEEQQPLLINDRG